ncbi:MAG: PorT family protein [Hymenobacter sp.]|nr:MAG: PorT family protein [Hymenobacter sp.]
MNKLLAIPLLSGSLFLFATAAHAQLKVSIGPVVGETLMKQHLSNDTKLDYRFGLVAGAQAYLSWGRFALQPALLFSQKGSQYATQVLFRTNPSSPDDYLEFKTRTRLNYLTLPLNFTFAPAGTATGPQFFAGPYVSMLLGGSVEQNELPGQPASTTAIRVTSEADLYSGPASRRFDAGLQAGAGFRYNGLVLQAHYSLGLTSTKPDYTSQSATVTNDLKVYNRGFQVSIGYLFAMTHEK